MPWAVKDLSKLDVLKIKRFKPTNENHKKVKKHDIAQMLFNWQ